MIRRRIFGLLSFSASPTSKVSSKLFSTTSGKCTRFGFRSPSSALKEIGAWIPPLEANTQYEPGTVFIHKTFAYKGIVVCAFNCRFHEKKSGSTEKTTWNRDFYQVLIHRNDWSAMRFPVDLTSYLMEGTTRGEKLLTVINGMDCASHEDIIPYSTIEQVPIDHDLYNRIFVRADGALPSAIRMRPDLQEIYVSSQKSWLAPRDVYREVTENIEVTVTTFYLGANMSGGQQKHMWRYVIRLENQKPDSSCVVRERLLKVYSLNNMNQAHGHGVVGKQPELSVISPAFQFSSTIELPHSKGGHMWGQFKMERENGSTFDVAIPTVTLEPLEDKAVEAVKGRE